LDDVQELPVVFLERIQIYVFPFQPLIHPILDIIQLIAQFFLGKWQRDPAGFTLHIQSDGLERFFVRALSN
jgi:hypothetical protein